MQRPIMEPAPGTHLVRHVGDRLSIRLGHPEAKDLGLRAFLRTNLTRGEVARRETIALLGRLPEDEATFAGASWRDIPLELREDGFALDLPLLEVGHFRAKAYVVDAEGRQTWPDGDDLALSVHPAHVRTGNTIYCAFPRCFGPSKRLEHTLEGPHTAEVARLDQAGYTVIPPSGTLRDVTAEVPHIVDVLGCRILHLLPIGPTPTTHARMGRFGSPYAQLDMTGIDPALVVFDKKTTGVDQFRELADAMHAREGMVFLDIVVNHTGWRSWLLENHPDWFLRESDGSFHSPGAWGVRWEDLVELDHTHPRLWSSIAESLLEWCRRGIDGFRCDAAYMVPLSAWQYILSTVRQEFPDTVFLAEGLGGPWDLTERLLCEGGMQWAYSELFQNFDPVPVQGYLDHAIRQSNRVGTLVHYSETHDNARLAKGGRAWSLFRNRLCALTSVSGGYGFTNGVEWLAEEQINVHSARGLAWGKAPNLVHELSRLTRLVSTHPCFFDGCTLERVSPDGSVVVAVARTSRDGRDHGLVLANLDTREPHTFEIAASVWDRGGPKTVELLGQTAPVAVRDGDRVRVSLGPLDCFFLAAKAVPDGETGDVYRKLRDAETFALSAIAAVLPHEAIGPADYRALAALVSRDPARFLGCLHTLDEGLARRDLVAALESAVAAGHMPQVVTIAPTDTPKINLVPPAHFVLVRDDRPFRARLEPMDGEPREHRSIAIDGGHVVVLPPHELREGWVDVPVVLRRFGETTTVLATTLRHLGERPAAPPPVPNLPESLALLVNGRGGMARIHMAPGVVTSKYDALLAANLHPSAPCDRHVLAKRVRLWVIADGFLTTLGSENLLSFEPGPPAVWRFAANAGDERRVAIRMVAFMREGENATVLRFEREAESPDLGTVLGPSGAVSLTVRIDLEDRGFHAETHRNEGSEHHFASNVHHRTGEQGFFFSPAPDRKLRVVSDSGSFHPEPEWTSAHHPLEATRGLVDHGDAYSPGWFDLPLGAGEMATILLTAESEVPDVEAILTPPAPKLPKHAPDLSEDAFGARLARAARAYLVRRDGGATVIAGYPWFLDWGRDTLIALRGLVVAGYHEETLDVLRTYGALERDGTLPNMLSADSTANRETSDAPLLYALACEDAARVLGESLYDEKASDGRTIGEILLSIARGYAAGAPNGVRVDAESGLVWSPPHYTWMDTNYPAATPREGYPIELAALWIRLLRQLERRGALGGDPHLVGLRAHAETSFSLYVRDDLPFLSDTLHAGPGTPARDARADDHLRPNMLTAIALGIVKGERAKTSVASATRRLLVPGGMRSLAPLPVGYELPIHAPWGELLGDPHHPYRGRYEGDEDRQRKPAYHNGTAWVFPLATYAEALVAAWDASPEARRAARAILGSTAAHLDSGCVGQLPEVLDGDAPHLPRGCDAQAWSVTETLRVWLALA